MSSSKREKKKQKENKEKTGKDIEGVILDASGLLALLLNESGSDKIVNVLNKAHLSAVNLEEVVRKLLVRGVDVDSVRRELNKLPIMIEFFNEEQAYHSSTLHPFIKTYDLSLGDRACLSLGLNLALPIYTADRSWKGLEKELNLEIVFIR